MNHNQKKINALRLIELVHQNEVIYNPKHPEFHDYGHKETVWAGIDQRLNCQEGDSKRKWTMLRDAFRRSVKIVQRNPNRREFKFARQMKFLLPFFQKFPKAEAEKDDYHNTINYQSADSRDGPEEVQVEHMDPESFAECLLINELDEEEKSRLIGDERMSIEFNHKQADPLAHTNHQSKYPSPLGISSRTTDAIDGFLLGIGASLRTFNPYNLNIAKQRIFNVVSDLEMEQIKARQAAIMAKYPTPGGSKRKTPALITADESANKKEKYTNDKIIFEDDKTSETDGEENE